MSKMKIRILAGLLVFVLPSLLIAAAPDISDAPKVIQELAESIQGKSLAETRRSIIQLLGPAQRNIGSGFSIEQWDIPEGVLTFHSAFGPDFYETKTEKLFRFSRTTTPAKSIILSSYEMTTLPAEHKYGTTFWIGNLKLGADHSYQFKDSGQFPDHRSEQTENFFMLYPKGTFKVRYVGSITQDTLLESLEENVKIAHLDFTSADQKHTATFTISSSERARLLTFGASERPSFVMDGGWHIAR